MKTIFSLLFFGSKKRMRIMSIKPLNYQIKNYMVDKKIKTDNNNNFILLKSLGLLFVLGKEDILNDLIPTPENIFSKHFYISNN